MYDVVPGALQHMREADIISRAGLTAASQGQEYCRIGAVHSTNRQGARLSGVVDLSNTPHEEGVTATNPSIAIEGTPPASKRFLVMVEIRDPQNWSSHCTCRAVPGTSMTLCAHAAALLYQWLAHPFTFVPPDVTSSILPAPKNQGSIPASPYLNRSLQPPDAKRRDALSLEAEYQAGLRSLQPPDAKRRDAVSLEADSQDGHRLPQSVGPLTYSPAWRPSSPAMNTAEFLAQLALGDLRGIAREYDIITNGLGKQELVEAIVAALKQPEAVRHVVGTLEKAQRQFLATLILAGGHMNDDELRGLFERFSLGKTEQLQYMLLALQGKALLVRASFNTSLQPRSGLSASLLDVNWYVPEEVRAALHIALPITSFDIEAQSDPPIIRHVEAYHLLADLLLVARALDGYRIEREDQRHERARKPITGELVRGISAQTGDGSTALPTPTGLPSASLLEWLQSVVPRPSAFLRFAFRILRLADILYLEHESANATMSILRMLPNAAELLLGPARAEVASELFMHWLHQSTYIELFDLQEEGLRLRSRATPMNQPALRYGELEAESRDARQALIILLAQAPLHQWINFTAFARFVYRLNPTFLQRRQRAFASPHWWIEQEEGRPLQPTQWNDWLRAEGRYLARLLQGPLYWWGASDLALSADGRLLAFRLTSMAGFLLNGMSIIEQDRLLANVPAEPAIEMSDQGELSILSSAENWPVIELIESFAEVQGVQAGRLSYRLTPKSLGEALHRGEVFAPLLDLLHRVVDASGVENSSMASALYQLERRIAHYGRVRLYTDVTLLEVADTLTMRELGATTSIEKQIAHRIHPTLVLLNKQGGEQLVEELKRRSQTPLLHEDE